jgi:hypothetical protein
MKIKAKPKSKPVKKLSGKPRTRVVERHRSFKLTQKKLKQRIPLPGAIKLFNQTIGLIRRNKKLFLGIALINAAISLIFVQGFSAVSDTVIMKQTIEESLGENADRLGTSIAVFGYLMGSAGVGTTQAGVAYQFFLVLVTSLAIIWGVRQVTAGEAPRLKDSFYKGMYPLIPFLLVLFVVALQFLPFVIGNLIFNTVIQNEVAVTLVEKFVWLLLFIGLALLSAYMLVSSLFALYIATLPEMTPLVALRSARELVLHRRWSVGIRLIALPIVLAFFGALIFIPLLMFATPVAPILFIALTGLSLVITHIYMYLLYRALI